MFELFVLRDGAEAYDIKTVETLPELYELLEAVTVSGDRYFVRCPDAASLGMRDALKIMMPAHDWGVSVSEEGGDV